MEKRTSFWKDVWIGNCPLKVRFSNLFKIWQDPDISTADCCRDGVWNIKFIRSFGGDKEKSGQFCIKSLYRHISFGGVTNRKMQKLWSRKIPLKVKIFHWQTYQDRIQTAEQLKRRSWRGKINCILCGVKENAKHVLFACALARFT